MYAWLWRQLPGGTAVRVLQAAAILVAVLLVLGLWVFPWAEERLPSGDVTVDARVTTAPWSA